MTAIDETRNALLLLEQELRDAREGAMPLSRERVAALAFHLASTIEHLAVLAPALPDNDQAARMEAGSNSPLDAVSGHGLLQLHQELKGKPGQRLIVASLGSRWCVIAGHRGAPLSSYEPVSWHEHKEDATRAAIRLHKLAHIRGYRATELVRS